MIKSQATRVFDLEEEHKVSEIYISIYIKIDNYFCLLKNVEN
jgi:hypothetical protein